MTINKAQCREYLLAAANRKWPGKFTRVADNVYPHLEAEFQRVMDEFIRAHPTLGKTLSMGAPKREDDV